MAAHLQSSNLFASIDMGTLAFKLLIVHFEATTSKFTTVLHLSHPVVLGLDSSSSSPPSISPDSRTRSFDAMRNFKAVLSSYNVGSIRVVATSAIREAGNRSEFVDEVREILGFDVQFDVLSGVEEAKLTYFGVLQFFPVQNNRVLTVDIGGGSTEFVVGFDGEVVFADSLTLGHVTLTQKFEKDVVKLRDYLKDKIESSGLVEKVKNLGFDVAIGSSGTIREIEKAIWCFYGTNEEEDLRFSEEFRNKRKWWCFSRKELNDLVERLCSEGQREKFRRDEFFGKRSRFIVAGSILLEMIFELLGITEMQASGYALAEGVVTDMIKTARIGCDLSVNVRWKSVVRLAMRFNGKERMNASGQCALVAKGSLVGTLINGLRDYEKVEETHGTTLDDKDLEYLEAACMLHNIGLYFGKKGYHKRSYSIIMECNQLSGYTREEIQVIALLAKHHRKKFPKFEHTSLQFFSEKKIGKLCCILRLSVILQKIEFGEIKFNHSSEGLMLVLVEKEEQHLLSDSKGLAAKDIEIKIRKEVNHFERAFHQKLLVVVHRGSLDSSAGK